MAKREIYEVHVAYVTSAGYHACDPTLSGTEYPKIIDSKNSNNDLNLTLRKAKGYLGEAEKILAGRVDDQIDYCYIIRCSDGRQIESRKFGTLADLPDPEPEVGEE